MRFPCCTTFDASTKRVRPPGERRISCVYWTLFLYLLLTSWIAATSMVSSIVNVIFEVVLIVCNFFRCMRIKAPDVRRECGQGGQVPGS